MFFVVRLNDSFNFPLGLIKYIVMTLNPKEADFFSIFFVVVNGLVFIPFKITKTNYRLFSAQGLQFTQWR